MEKINLTEQETLNLTDKEIEWSLENEAFLAQEYIPKLKYDSIVMNGRPIRNSSHARRGVMGILNRKRQKERQNNFFSNVKDGLDKNKIRIVTEGDSWFNYPTKLPEVIDYLFEDYSIYSLGYAGDWLSNIYEEQEYITAIRLYKPDIFIISGGGNDLVGSRRLKNILRKYKLGNKAPDLIIKWKYDKIIEDFRVIYETIFNQLTSEHPTMKIICHGYDYPYLEGEEKNWLGKPMRRKGIKDLTLRNDIAKILIDGFNEMLFSLSSEYSQVNFIDIRGKVPRDNWKDELHPNAKGFEIVANIFKEKITEISNT